MTERELMNDPGVLQNFADVIIKFGDAMDAMVKEFSIVLEWISPAIQEAHDGLWQAYLDAGTPFGENEEGLSRWLERMH